MMETLKMWRLVRYLTKNQHEFIDWDEIDTGPPLSRHIETLIRITMQSRYPRGLRFVLAKRLGEMLYSKRFPAVNPRRDLREEEKKVRDDFSEKSAADVQQRISDCAHKGFIGEDEENQQLVFLTLKGRKFATPYGLVKEWVMENIGEMRSIVGAIIGTAALIKWRAIWNLIRGISFVVFDQ